MSGEKWDLSFNTVTPRKLNFRKYRYCKTVAIFCSCRYYVSFICFIKFYQSNFHFIYPFFILTIISMQNFEYRDWKTKNYSVWHILEDTIFSFVYSFISIFLCWLTFLRYRTSNKILWLIFVQRICSKLYFLCLGGLKCHAE